MSSRAPREARWVRGAPRRSLSAAYLQQIVRCAIGPAHVFHAEPLTAGLRNANFKVHLDGKPECIVLRIYEHDVSLCPSECEPPDFRRLLDLMALCESLTHDDLPAPIVAELLELIRATVEDRDPVLA